MTDPATFTFPCEIANPTFDREGRLVVKLITLPADRDRILHLFDIRGKMFEATLTCKSTKVMAGPAAVEEGKARVERRARERDRAEKLATLKAKLATPDA